MGGNKGFNIIVLMKKRLILIPILLIAFVAVILGLLPFKIFALGIVLSGVWYYLFDLIVSHGGEIDGL